MKINLNNSPVKQGDTYRFGLNVVTDPEHVTSLSNEKGNQLCVEFDAELAGPPLLIDRNKQVVFLKDNSIWIVNTETCTKELYCQLDEFGWDILDTDNYPVTATWRVVRGCETIIYAFNGITSDLAFNLDRPEKMQTGGVFDYSKFQFNPEIVHSTITREILNNGGQLQYGTYNFCVEWLNQNEDSLFITPVDINYTPIIYRDGNGALNISNNLPDIGGKPLSNNSIKLTISNIPEDAILARIIVFRHITGDGFTSDAHVVGSLIPIKSGTLQYVYRGFSTDGGDYIVDKNAYLSVKQVYGSSLNAVQVNNRLLRYNLKESIRDYSTYQFYASKICAKYVVKEVNKDAQDIYLLNQTFLGGEIILPCINYVHADGTISPSFPLIGRAKNTNDTVLVDDIFNQNQQVEKWKLYDTSIKDATPISGYISSGEFGYYESDEKYTNPPNYCGNSYWGTDYEGNLLEDQPVRLFVVPDRAKEPHENGNNIYPIGIHFESIEYPEGVVGHYFSLAIVQDSNVQAKGIGFNNEMLINLNNANIGLPKQYRYNISPLTAGARYNFASANYLISGSLPSGSYAASEGYWNVNIVQNQKNYNSIFNSDLPYDDLELKFNYVSQTGFVPFAQEHKEIIQNFSIEPLSILTVDNDNFINGSNSNSFNYIQLANNFNTGTSTQYISVKNELNPITNIWAIRTRRITKLNDNVSFNGDNFISPLNIDNVMDVYDINGFVWTDNTIVSRVEYITGLFVESKYNMYLRHLGTDSCNKHVQSNLNVENLFFNKIAEPYQNKYKLRNSICPFFPGYNSDYSYVQELNKYSTLGLTFDFCSECTGLYPHRIIFSPQSFSEDLADGYRVNLPNDYIDIPSNTGEIIAVDFRDNKLVVRTERSTYFLQPNPQQMETSESNVYIGTGDFLSIPAQELNVSQPGYGGQQFKLDSINTEKGLVWADRQRGDIYLLGGQFNELGTDMSKWFSDNLNNNKLVMSYDPFYDRLLVTCRNNWTLSYCFKHQGWKSWHSYIPQYYSFNHNMLYSVHDNKLWSHDSDKYTIFYNLEFPAIKEFILNNQGVTFKPQSVQYHANTYTFVNGYEEDVLDITYDEFMAYNDRQTTGIQKLRLNDELSVFFNNIITDVKQTDRNYKISPLKDLSVSSNIWTTDITPIKQGTQGYMDKLPLYDATIQQVSQADFRSKWLGVRLITNNHNNKIGLEWADSLKLNSFR